MKKALSFLFAMLILICPVFSHSGRTDASGGHNGPGGYHYHHGYPAHQHTDGVCPYDFDDNVDRNSSHTGESSINVNKSSHSSSAFLALGILALPVASALSIHHIKNRIDTKRREQEQRRIFEEERRRYAELYGEKSPEELVEIPDGVEIGLDGFPKLLDTTDWGEDFTFYISPYGKALHHEYGCSGATLRVHACQVISSDGTYSRRPCFRCCLFTQIPDLRWYAEYLKIKAIKERYGID